MAATRRITRRQWVQAGAVAGGLTLAGLLRAEAAAGVRGSRKSIINIHLDGGPPHQDMIDLKPQAPVEIRGEFTGIATRLPGFHLCEHLPKLAALAERFVFVRTLVGSAGAHDGFQCQSGWDAKSLASMGGRPAFGAVVQRLRGSVDDPAPAFVDLMQGRPFVRNSARPGFLGPACQPFRPDISHLFTRPLEEGMKRELAARGSDHAVKLTLDERVDGPRLQSRAALAGQLDKLRRDIDPSRMMDAMDQFTRQAIGILTSGELAQALDLSREDEATLRRYEPNGAMVDAAHSTSEGPGAMKKFLLARRMVEAGARCVNISLSDFDTHADNFGRMKRLLPVLDQGLTALVEDLAERDWLDDVTIVAWGEFGRTPKVDSSNGGRHHWPAVGMCLLAGGGLRTGQVLGATDRDAGLPVSRPVHYQDVIATLYHQLGIDPQTTTLIDPAGRPQHLLDSGRPIRELI